MLNRKSPLSKTKAKRSTNNAKDLASNNVLIFPKVIKPWFVYLLECQDGSIYTGIAVNVAARYALHVAGKGARYTRSHPPKCILAVIEYPDRSAASRAEHEVKLLSHNAKLKLSLNRQGG